jgi:hypothetical protein
MDEYRSGHALITTGEYVCCSRFRHGLTMPMAAVALEIPAPTQRSTTRRLEETMLYPCCHQRQLVGLAELKSLVVVVDII